jgi:hypothetical protein
MKTLFVQVSVFLLQNPDINRTGSRTLRTGDNAGRRGLHVDLIRPNDETAFRALMNVFPFDLFRHCHLTPWRLLNCTVAFQGKALIALT